MSAPYYYPGLVSKVDDGEDVNFTVEFVSDGNSGPTMIKTPLPPQKEVKDAGTVFIGKGKDLRSPETIATSNIANPIPEEDTIWIRYKINGVLLKEHKNKKSENEHPVIVLIIKFI